MVLLRRLINPTSRQQQTGSNKLGILKSETKGRKGKTRGVDMQRRKEQEDGEGKKLPLTTAGVQGLLEEYSRRIQASRLSFGSVVGKLIPCR